MKAVLKRSKCPDLDEELAGYAVGDLIDLAEFLQHRRALLWRLVGEAQVYGPGGEGLLSVGGREVRARTEVIEAMVAELQRSAFADRRRLERLHAARVEPSATTRCARR